MSALSDGSPGFKAMRYAGDLFQVAQLAATFQLTATRSMIQRYRKGESLERWYLREVKPKLEEIQNSTITFNVVEHK